MIYAFYSRCRLESGIDLSLLSMSSTSETRVCAFVSCLAKELTDEDWTDDGLECVCGVGYVPSVDACIFGLRISVGVCGVVIGMVCGDWRFAV